MKEELALIHSKEVLGKEFKMYGTFEKPIFQAKDIANWIEIFDAQQMLDSLDEDEKGKYIILTPGGPQEVWCVTEDGLYEILMMSRKPIAKAFKKQVKEILRSVRKHGAYMTPDVIERSLTDPDFLIQIATTLKEERQKRLEAENALKLVAPKVNFAESVEISPDSVLIRFLSNILKQNGIEIGQNRLFDEFRKRGYLIKGGKDRNMPTQRSMEMGLFEVKERTVNAPDGEPRIQRTPYVTGKGQIYFTNLFFKEVA